MRNVWDRIELHRADITKLDCDAIVNAANSSLLGGGGVDGAIHRAAGPALLGECKTLGGCPTGEARITRGYDLPSRHVIHTVGPVYRDGRRGEPELLRSCHDNALRLVVDNGLRTVAFPAISCGIYGYPMPDAARIALATTAAFLEEHASIERAIFALFSADALEVFDQARHEMIESQTGGP